MANQYLIRREKYAAQTVLRGVIGSTAVQIMITPERSTVKIYTDQVPGQ